MRPAAAGTLLLTSAVAGLVGAPAASAAAPSSCSASAADLSLLGAPLLSAGRATSTPCVTGAGSVDLTALGTVSASLVQAATARSANATAGGHAKVAGLDAGVGGFTSALTGPLLTGPNTLLPAVGNGLGTLIGPGSVVQTAIAPLSALGLSVTGVDASALTSELTTSLPGALTATLPDLLEAGVIEASADAVCVSGVPTLSGTSTLSGVKVLGTPIDINDPVGKALSLDTEHLTLAQLVSVTTVLKGIVVQAAPLSVIGVLTGSTPTTLYDVLVTPGGLLGTVNAALPVGTTLASILGELDGALAPALATAQVPLPAGILQAVVTPRTQVTDGDTLTQTALTVSVTALSQPLLAGALARASVAASSAGCVTPIDQGPSDPGPSDPTPNPTPTPKPVPTAAEPDGPVSQESTPVSGPEAPKAPVTAQGSPTPITPAGSTPGPTAPAPAKPDASRAFAAAALQCDALPLRLTDVRQSGSRTLVQGVAESRYVGQKATIFLTYGNKKVGTATVGGNGRFQTYVPLPARGIATTNSARYYAVISGKRTAALKFARRMYTTSLTSAGGSVTFKGRVTLPRARKQASVVIQQRVSCGSFKPVGRVTPDARGRFSITLKAPAGGVTSAIYRAQTRVPKAAGSQRAFATYTLPKVLVLGR